MRRRTSERGVTNILLSPSPFLLQSDSCLGEMFNGKCPSTSLTLPPPTPLPQTLSPPLSGFQFNLQVMVSRRDSGGGEPAGNHGSAGNIQPEGKTVSFIFHRFQISIL